MSDPSPQRRTFRLGDSARVALAALITSGACARFGYELPDWTSAGPGPGGSGGASADAGSAGSSAAGGVGGAGGEGNAPAGAGGAAGVAGSENGGNGGVAGSGGSTPDAGAPSCADGARNGDEAGIDCGGSSCAPCACVLAQPQRLGDPNYSGNDLWAPSLSGDGLSLYFGLTVPGIDEQIAVSTRPDRASPFGLGSPLPPPINQAIEGTPHVAANGLALYFFSERNGGAGGRDLFVATRSRQNDDFGNVRALSELNTPGREHLPWLSADERTIYFVSNRGGGNDIFRASRGAKDDPFSNIEAVTELNGDSEDGGITLSPDGLEAIFSSNRPGGVGQRDLYRATRASTSDAFTSIELITGIDTGENEFDPSLSPDGTELYFTSNRDGSDNAVYRAARSCGQ